MRIYTIELREVWKIQAKSLEEAKQKVTRSTIMGVANMYDDMSLEEASCKTLKIESKV